MITANPDTMRVLHVITTLSRGGAEHHLLTMVRGQAARGCKIQIVFLKGDGNLAERFLQAGAEEVRKIPMERPADIPSFVLSLRRHLARNPVDVVHTHLLKANCLGGIAARLLWRRPAVVSSKHNDEHYLRSQLVGLAHGVISRCCDDHVIALSDHVKDFVCRHGHVCPERITRVYYGFDPEVYPASRPVDPHEEFSIPGGHFVFGIVARVTEQKGHLDLLEAFSNLLDRFPNTHLLVVGGPGYNDRFLRLVEARIEALSLLDHVTMAGQRPDAFSIIGALDCLVMPSHWEGFGMVFLEALFQGVPVVATTAGAIPEVVRDGIDGILAAPRDPDSLCNAMTEMVANHGRFRERLSEQGRSDILERFPTERMVSETLRVYELQRN